MEHKARNRKASVEKLRQLIDSSGMVTPEQFLECLYHPYQLVRIEAIEIVADRRFEEFTPFFAIALNDECDSVKHEAAEALAKINTARTLDILSTAFFENKLERPHHLASAIATFGERGFGVLKQGLENDSPNIRYYSARGLGSTGMESARPILENLRKADREKTTFGGLVSTAAKKGLKTLDRIQKAKRRANS